MEPLNSPRRQKELQNVTFSNDGNTPDQAIKINGITTHPDFIAAEYQYLNKQFGKQDKDWQFLGQSLEFSDGKKPVDAFNIRTSGGKEQKVYFDLSSIWPES